MPELKLKADILLPQHEKILKYSGSHPSRVLKIIPTLVKDTFKIRSTNFYEDSIKWDTSADPIAFYGAWRGVDSKDARTSLWVNVKVQGEQEDKSKKGEVTIWISGTLVTDLPYTNILEKMISRSYSYLFYAEHRRRYIAEAKRLFEIFEGEIRKQLEMMGG